MTMFDFGNALFFDGVNDVLTFPHGEDLNFGTGDFTICFWINGVVWYGSGSVTMFSIIAGDYRILIRTPIGNSRGRFFIQLEQVSTGTIHATSGAVSTYADLNRWNFVRLKREGTMLSVQVNRKLKQQITTAGIMNLNMPASGQNWQLFGNRNSFYIDYLLFFRRALTANEELFLYNDGLGNTPDNLPALVRNYRFNQPAGDASLTGSLVDSGVSARHGTLTGYTAGAIDFINHYTV